MQGHPDQLISKWTTGMDNNRYKADPESKYYLYIELLREKTEQYYAEMCHTYNTNEKSLMFGVAGPSN